MRTSSRGSITVVAALSVALLLVAAAYQLRTEPTDEGEQLMLDAFSPEEYTLPLPEEDTDDDGIPDWQEALIGTDPNDPDPAGTGVTTHATQVRAATSTRFDLSAEVGERILSAYTELKETGSYNEERGARLGENIAYNLAVATPFVPYTADDVATDADTSYDRTLTYREDMRKTLEPLLSLGEAEFVLYGRFIESGDIEALQEINASAVVYEDVAAAAAELTVPVDALDKHLAVTNALGYFAEVLRNMAKYAYDPIASLSLLRSYTEADAYITTTFNTLSNYYVLKYNEYNQ